MAIVLISRRKIVLYLISFQHFFKAGRKRNILGIHPDVARAEEEKLGVDGRLQNHQLIAIFRFFVMM